jgi:MFS family permease
LSETTLITSDKESIWTPFFLKLFIINAILNLGQFMAIALIPKFAEHLGASAAIVGIVSSMFAITALAVRPIVGPSTGYFRKNRLLATAIGFILAAFVCYGIASSIPMIIVGRLLHGIGMGFLAPVILALASDALPNRKLASGIGIFSLGQAMATAIGPIVGLKLVQEYGYHAAFITCSVLMGIVLALSLRLKTELPDRGARFKVSIHDIVAIEVMIPTIILFFLAGANSCIQAFILIYGGVNGVKEIGLFFMSYAVCVLFSRIISGRIADKYGIDKVIIPGILLFALSFVVISFSHTLPLFLIAGGISAFGYGICLPSIQTLCIQLVTKARRGVASNTTYIGVDIGYLITPIIAGLIVTFVQEHSGSEIAGYAAMYRYMTIPIFIALFIFLIKRKELISKLNKSELTTNLRKRV